MPRQETIEVDVECIADDGYFADELAAGFVAELALNGPIPCEGSGIGLWCDGCRFCAKFDPCPT